MISYDNELGKQVTQEPQVWIVGLSEEAGAGSCASGCGRGEAARKLHRRNIVGTSAELVWRIQVRRAQESLLYQPNQLPAGYYDRNINWKSWTSWSKKGYGGCGPLVQLPSRSVGVLVAVSHRTEHNRPGHGPSVVLVWIRLLRPRWPCGHRRLTTRSLGRWREPCSAAFRRSEGRRSQRAFPKVCCPLC